MGGSSGGSTNTVTKSDPWAGQQPYLTQGFEAAKTNYESANPLYYQGSTVADQSDVTKQAQTLQAARAVNGNPLQTGTNTMLQNTIEGDYLNNNPYLDAVYQTGADKITNNYLDATGQVASSLAGAGRYGSGVHQAAVNDANDTLASNLGDLYNQTYYNNYQTERGNQMSAAGMAPTMINQDYTDLSKLSDVGASQDQYAQTQTDANVDRWNYEQNLPYNKLAQYLGLINGSYGQTSTTSTPVSGSSSLGSALAASAFGLGAYNSMR